MGAARRRTLLWTNRGYRIPVIHSIWKGDGMKETQVILNRLLDKFENSKHLSEPNTHPDAG